MTTKIFLSISLIFSISLSVFAQTATTNYTINGVVTDLSGVSVPYATVSLKKDSVSQIFLKRTAADVDGKFQMEVSLDSGLYVIQIEAVGFGTLLQPIELADKRKIDAGKFLINEASTELNEVQIVATKPLVTQGLDRIGYDVEADPENKINNVLEMLRKVPLVTVDGDENIQVKGSSSFKIYINGKPSNMVTKNPKDVLKSMPASSIKKIEIITDPGAKYDAEGVTAILNIITQSTLQGFQGSISARANTRGNLGGSAYISSKIGKFGVTANYGYNQYSSPSWQTTHSEYFTENMPYKYLNSNSEGGYKGNWNWGNMELSYEFDTLNLVSASIGINGGTFKNPDDKSFSYMKNAALDTLGAYFTKGSSKNNNFGINGNIDYQRTFNKKEQLLTISYLFDLSPINSENISTITHDNKFPIDLNPTAYNQKFVKRGKTDEHTFQIDYTEPFNENKHVIEAGVKYILRMNIADNDYKLYDDLTGKYDRDTLRSANDMKYFQHIFGAYGSYTFKLKKFSVRVGARLEGTLQNVRFLDPLDTINKDFKIKLFDVVPSISFSYKPTEKSTFKLGYNNGITRPSIWELNPYIDDSNPKFLSYGNPNLNSERSHRFSLGYGYVAQKFNTNISASYSLVNNSIESYNFVDTAAIIHSTYANIGKNQWFSVNIYFNYNPWKWFRLWFSGGGYYDEYKNNDYTYGNYVFNGWGGANFTLPSKFKFNIGGGGSSSWVGYNTKGSPWYYYYFSLSRSFLKGDKLTVSISTNNPFEKYRTYTSKHWENNIFEYNNSSKQISRDFGISVSWRFGEMKAQIKKAERGISNDDVKSSGGNSGGSGGNQGGGN